VPVSENAITTWLAKPVQATGQVNVTSEIVKPKRGRPKGAKNKPKDEKRQSKKSDVPSEQELKNIERRMQEVRLAREYGVDPKELEGMSPAEVKEYFGQVRAAYAKAKTKSKKKRKNILDGEVVAKRLAAKLNKIRKQHGNSLELSVNQLQPIKDIMINKANIAKQFKSWLSGKRADTETRKPAVKGRTSKTGLVGAGLTGAAVASVIPPSNKEMHEAQAREKIERYS